MKPSLSLLFLTFSLSLFANEEISYLDIPEQIVTSLNVNIKDTSDILTCLKAFVNNGSYPLKSDFKKQTIDWVQSRNCSSDKFIFCLDTLLGAHKKLSLIPHPDSLVLSRKNDLQELANGMIHHVPKKILFDFFDHSIREDETVNLVKFLNINPSSLKKFLTLFNQSKKKEELREEFCSWIQTLDQPTIHILCTTLEGEEKNAFFEALFAFYTTSKDVRSYISSNFPKENGDLHFSVAKKCCMEEKGDLVHILLDLLTPPFRESLKQKLKSENIVYENALPGHIGSEDIFRTSFLGQEVYFYMSRDKYDSISSLIEGIEKDMVLSVQTESNHQKVQIIPEIFKLASSSEKNDLLGKAVMDRYLNESSKLFSDKLYVDLAGIEGHFDLCLNQDRILCPFHFASKSMTFHEYAVADWQMPSGTISGLILDDGKEGDRFILPIFRKDVACISIVKTTDTFATKQPFYFSPIDYESHLTSGSTKGKNLVIQTCGEITHHQAEMLQNKSKVINLPRPLIENHEKIYPNGIQMKKTSMEDFPSLESLQWLGYNENIDVFIYDLKNNDSLISNLKEDFNLGKSKFQKAYHLVKRTSGLSHLNKLYLEIPSNATLVLINRSSLPTDYEYFNIAEDQTEKGLPWIQLYRFSKEFAMKMNQSTFQTLSLTPIEEFLFRNNLEHYKENDLKRKVVTEIDVYIFNEE